jgi:transcriptional regulator with XRE-family HTH domain
MATTQIEQPPVMKLIRERRKRLHLSYDRAGELAGISGTRWRQLEGGFRAVKGTYFTESAPAPTLARMALAVGMRPADVREHSEDAAGEMTALAEIRARADTDTRAEAVRMVGTIGGLTDRQRRLLEDSVADDLRRVREES